MSSIQIPVSVLIPCYKSTGTIDRALNSVLNQTVVPAEIILLDDASRDGTYEKLLSLQSWHSLYLNCPLSKKYLQKKNRIT